MTDIVKRLRASVAMDAHHGDRRERDMCGHQMTTAAAEIEGLRAEIEKLRAALEERECDMHARIRAEYDKTVADSWRAENGRLRAEIEKLRAELAAWAEGKMS